MSYAQLLQRILKLEFVELRTLNPPSKFPANYDANARCDFHSKAPDHDIENCRALKYKVQYFLDTKEIEFTPNSQPNVTQNPMPTHQNPAANSIERHEGLNLVKHVNQLRIVLSFVKK